MTIKQHQMYNRLRREATKIIKSTGRQVDYYRFDKAPRRGHPYKKQQVINNGVLLMRPYVTFADTTPSLLRALGNSPVRIPTGEVLGIMAVVDGVDYEITLKDYIIAPNGKRYNIKDFTDYNPDLFRPIAHILGLSK